MATLFTPIPGTVYKMIFESGYNSFDGVYKLASLMTYDEYIEKGGNLLVDFYTPNQKTEEDLNNDLPNIRISKIMKLVSPNTDETVEHYAPIIFLKETPDFNIKKYMKFGIVGYVGITDNPDDLSFIKENIKEQFEAALGITIEPQYVSTGEIWLSDEEYAEVLKERDDTKKRVINYYSENVRLVQQNTQLRTMIGEYKTLVIALQKEIEKLEGGEND